MNQCGMTNCSIESTGQQTMNIVDLKSPTNQGIE